MKASSFDARNAPCLSRVGAPWTSARNTETDDIFANALTIKSSEPSDKRIAGGLIWSWLCFQKGRKRRFIYYR